MLGGQNKYWGTVEEATETWSSLGVNHLMIKSTNDIPLISPKGKIIVEDFKKLGKLQDDYGVTYHLHPYNIFVQKGNRKILLDTLTKEARPTYRQLIHDIDKQIQENGLYPFIELHLTTLHNPKLEFEQTEEEGIKAEREFLDSLDLESKLALETMPDPYENPGYSLLGFKAEHFVKTIGNKNFGICIDTGHSFKAKESLKKFLDLPYPIFSIHYNSWVGNEDSHHIPKRKNIKDVDLFEDFLKNFNGLIVFEIRNYNYSKEELQKLIQNTLNTVVT